MHNRSTQSEESTVDHELIDSNSEQTFHNPQNVDTQGQRPQRQPRLPPETLESQRLHGFAPETFKWQKLQGFAHFLKEHVSPSHSRVTSGGRVVPAGPKSPPPTFKMDFLDRFLTDIQLAEGQLGEAEAKIARDATESGETAQNSRQAPIMMLQGRHFDKGLASLNGYLGNQALRLDQLPPAGTQSEAIFSYGDQHQPILSNVTFGTNRFESQLNGLATASEVSRGINQNMLTGNSMIQPSVDQQPDAELDQPSTANHVVERSPESPVIFNLGGLYYEAFLEDGRPVMRPVTGIVPQVSAVPYQPTLFVPPTEPSQDTSAQNPMLQMPPTKEEQTLIELTKALQDDLNKLEKQFALHEHVMSPTDTAIYVARRRFLVQELDKVRRRLKELRPLNSALVEKAGLSALPKLATNFATRLRNGTRNQAQKAAEPLPSAITNRNSRDMLRTAGRNVDIKTSLSPHAPAFIPGDAANRGFGQIVSANQAPLQDFQPPIAHVTSLSAPVLSAVSKSPIPTVPFHDRPLRQDEIAYVEELGYNDPNQPPKYCTTVPEIELVIKHVRDFAAKNGCAWVSEDSAADAECDIRVAMQNKYPIPLWDMSLTCGSGMSKWDWGKTRFNVTKGQHQTWRPPRYPRIENTRVGLAAEKTFLPDLRERVASNLAEAREAGVTGSTETPDKGTGVYIGQRSIIFP